MSNQRVLIVTSDWPAANELTKSFETRGFEAKTASSAKDGASVAKQFLPGLVVVDLDLLAADGFDFCWKLRMTSLTRHVRILMLSDGRGDDGELLGLTRGADDYLVKPFRIEHLMYRVRILLKQKSIHEHIQLSISRDAFELNYDRRIATVDGIDMGLTDTEFRLVWAMAQNPGIVFSRIALVNQCRGNDANCLERTIDVHMAAIRRKLGKLSEIVETVRGVGYRFREANASNNFEIETDHDSVPTNEYSDLIGTNSVSAERILAAS